MNEEQGRYTSSRVPPSINMKQSGPIKSASLMICSSARSQKNEERGSNCSSGHRGGHLLVHILHWV